MFQFEAIFYKSQYFNTLFLVDANRNVLWLGKLSQTTKNVKLRKFY